MLLEVIGVKTVMTVVSDVHVKYIIGAIGAMSVRSFINVMCYDGYGCCY